MYLPSLYFSDCSYAYTYLVFASHSYISPSHYLQAPLAVHVAHPVQPCHHDFLFFRPQEDIDPKLNKRQRSVHSVEQISLACLAMEVLNMV